ncbi:hypothetical protein Tco_0098678 [Tanacetum coccineum]
MLLALEGKNKTGFRDGSCKMSNTDEVLGRQWDRMNAVVLGWILNSMLNALWKLFDALIELPRYAYHAADGFKKHNQLMKLMQFLMGLDDTYMQIRSSIISIEILPIVKSAYATISIEESHKVASGSISGTSQRSQASTFVSNSDSRHSSVPGECVNTNDFPSGNFGNDAQSSDDTFDAQNEQVTTLEDDIVFEGIVNQNPSTSTQSTQNLRRSSRQTIFSRNYNDFVIDSKVNEPKTFFEAFKFAHWTDATNNKMDALLRNDIWEITELPKDRKAIGDVNNAFLYGDLVETVYVKPPEGYFPSGDNKVCKLKKSFQSKSDYSLYAKSDKGVFVALLVYVDDIIITGNSISKIEKLLILIKSKLIITNKATIDDPLLDNIIDYQKLKGKLIYLTNSRHDISYVVHCLSQFMHSSLKSHLKTAFKILRYLKGSPNLGIHITKSPGMNLKAYSDDDWENCVVTRRSVTGTVYI